MFHPVSPLFSLFGKPFCRLCFVLFVLGCVLSLCCFEWLPTLSRCRSFLPDLMTVRAVMVRAALEKKKARPCSPSSEMCAMCQRTHNVRSQTEEGRGDLQCDFAFLS